MTQEYSNKGTKKYFGNKEENFYQNNVSKTENQKANGLEKTSSEEITFVEPNPIMFMTGMFSEINRIYNKFK